MDPLSDCKRLFVAQFLLLAATVYSVAAIQPPSGVTSSAGDKSVILHWERNTEPNLFSYRVYRSLTNGPFSLLSSNLVTPGYCDLDVNVINGRTNSYYITAVTTTSEESAPSTVAEAVPHLFVSDDEFLGYVQRANFDYFWYGANPANGLIPDRSANGSACSIAAVGFGLSAIGIGIDHGWISRTQGVTRTLTTLNTFLSKPQGPNTSGVIGYNGWFYHFLDMNTALRDSGTELSSIDTALLLGGVLYSKQYFDGQTAEEASIRAMAQGIFDRVDWNWMARGTNTVAMGWFPESGFIPGDGWIGYNEGMIIYALGLGATNPLPASAWSRWTSGYVYSTYFGFSYVAFPPLFTHQYSHCWIDFRHIADDYMNAHNSTYFENSRRATLAQQQYCIAVADSGIHRGYSSNVWGLTACDGPNGYKARGAPGQGSLDDGTIAPTAAGGSMAFAAEICLPTLRYFYDHFRKNIWTEYGFRDAFNLGAQWYGTDEIGIDQGPIILMIENYRTQRVWDDFMRSPEIQRGLLRAGFIELPSVASTLRRVPDQNAFSLSWESAPGRTYQIEYSPDLDTWFASPTGLVNTNGPSAMWTDSGPPNTTSVPLNSPERFYRVIQYGPPSQNLISTR
jgi:hypothetical protein